MKIKIEKGFWKEFLKVFGLTFVLITLLLPVGDCEEFSFPGFPAKCYAKLFPLKLYDDISHITFYRQLFPEIGDYAIADLRKEAIYDLILYALLSLIPTLVFIALRNKFLTRERKIANKKIKEIFLFFAILIPWVVLVPAIYYQFLHSSFYPGFYPYAPFFPFYYYLQPFPVPKPPFPTY